MLINIKNEIKKTCTRRKRKTLCCSLATAFLISRDRLFIAFAPRRRSGRRPPTPSLTQQPPRAGHEWTAAAAAAGGGAYK